MAGHWTNLFTYTTGVVRYHDLAYVAMVGDELTQMKVDHCYITEWDAGTWRRGELDNDESHWGAVSATVVQEPLEQGLFLGTKGQVFCLGSGETHLEIIEGVENLMRGLGTIEGIAYACGMNRQVFMRTGANKWKAIDKGMRRASKGSDDVGFEAIAGFSKKEIYAAGWNGEIWQFDGKKWYQQKSPTELIITSICCGEDDIVYMCGQSGTLIQGRNSEWKILKLKQVTENLWSLAWYNGELYAAGMRAVYKLVKGQLTELDFGKDHPKSFYRLSAADGVLWSIGPKDVMAFNGKKWKRID